jgi:hypothetical protein
MSLKPRLAAIRENSVENSNFGETHHGGKKLQKLERFVQRRAVSQRS